MSVCHGRSRMSQPHRSQRAAESAAVNIPNLMLRRCASAMKEGQRVPLVATSCWQSRAGGVRGGGGGWEWEVSGCGGEWVWWGVTKSFTPVQHVSAAGAVLAAGGVPRAMLMLTPDGLTVGGAGRGWGRRRGVTADGGAPAFACGSASMHVSALAGMCDHRKVVCSCWHV